MDPQSLEQTDNITTLPPTSGPPPPVDEPQPQVQPVRAIPPDPTPEPPKKFWGEFDSEEEARLAFERDRAFKAAVVKDKDVQALVAQRHEQARLEEAQKLNLQKEEAKILEDYVEAMKLGKPDQAFVGLVRNITAIANRDARAAIKQELDQIAEPLRSKRQFLETNEWKDLHPVADEVVWLANELGKVGHQKGEVAELIDRVIKKAKGSDKVTDIRTKQRGPGILSPDSGGYLSDLSEKDYDKQVDQWWKQAGYK